MKRRDILLTWVVGLGLGGALVAWMYAIFSAAAYGDQMSRELSAHLATRVPQLVVRRKPDQQVADGIAFGPLSWGSIGDCDYRWLRNCVSLQIDSGIDEHPLVRQTLVWELLHVCETLVLSPHGGETAMSGQRQPGSAIVPINHDSRLLAYLSCKSEKHRPVRIQLNVVSGFGLTPRVISLPSGGNTYAAQDRKLLYQILIVRRD